MPWLLLFLCTSVDLAMFYCIYAKLLIFQGFSMLYHSNTAAGWKIICRFLDEFDS